MRNRSWMVPMLVWVAASACGGSSTNGDAGGPGIDSGGPDASSAIDAGVDASQVADAGSDASELDGGPEDAGLDASSDGGTPMDGGSEVADGASGDASDPPDAPPIDAGPCTPLPTSGELVIEGALSSASATWHRPDDSSVCPSTIIDDVNLCYVDTYVFCGVDAGSYRIALDGMYGPDTDAGTDVDAGVPLTLSDPYLVVYSGAPIPADVLMCLAINDDDPTATGLSSAISPLDVGAGEVITIAATTYDYVGLDTDSGTYRLIITRL